ncbi:MAG: hypothetical protein HRT88_09095 [Lentisphaeraceae bacterium]|nr:hypothetical protein [Lentisphaeraceae bacterium]
MKIKGLKYNAGKLLRCALICRVCALLVYVAIPSQLPLPCLMPFCFGQLLLAGMKLNFDN